jgi:hypothetical protein
MRHLDLERGGRDLILKFNYIACRINYLCSCWNPPLKFGKRWERLYSNFNNIEWKITLVAVGIHHLDLERGGRDLSAGGN